MKPLSKSQQKIFDYLKECAGEGRVPSVREICEETGLSSTSTVHHHLKALEEKGLISREHGVNRCRSDFGDFLMKTAWNNIREMLDMKMFLRVFMIILSVCMLSACEDEARRR